MRRLRSLLTSFLLFSVAVGASAQNATTCSDSEFRVMADRISSEGNRQYDRSHRDGIKQMADSLEMILKERSKAGRLHPTDSLEFTAALYKLRADWHYENGAFDSKSYKESEILFNKALDTYNRSSSFRNHLGFTPIIQMELAQLTYRLARYDEALAYTDSALKAYIQAYENEEFFETDFLYETMLTLRSQLALCLARVGRSSTALSEINAVLEDYPKDSDKYWETLRKKGKIIMLSGKDGCEKDALKYYREFMTWFRKDALVRLQGMDSQKRQEFWMRFRPFVSDAYQTKGADASFLYDIALFSKGLLLQIDRLSGSGISSESAIKSLQFTYKDIQKRLKANDCAIEFVNYEDGDRQQLGAIVLRKNGSPAWIQMASGAEFGSVEIERKNVKDRLRSTDGKTKNSIYSDEDIRTLFWNNDIIAAIGDAERVYFAGDGYVHQLAVEYMLPEALKDIEFFRLTSTRRLMEDSSIRTDKALLVGGVRYDSLVSSKEKDNDSMAYSYMKSIKARFKYLPGSLAECDSIAATRANADDMVLSAADATESAFKASAGRYPVLSISSHGFFAVPDVPLGTDIKTCMEDQSLSMSILAMSGASTSLSDTSFDPSTSDGILSAREISQMDLSNVDLAVLSACQTGLGTVTADGVFGMQRALKNAGVGSMLVSLWDVDDTATEILMTRFHKNITGGMKPHKALLEAREYLMSEATRTEKKITFDPARMSSVTTENSRTFAEPRYYDAFIMIDALE